MLIHVLSRRIYRAHCFTYPLRVFEQAIRRRGLRVRVFYRHDHPRLTRCDLVAVASDYFGITRLVRSPDAVVALLRQFRSKVKVLLWCDLSDDTGTLFEPAFSIVALYAKKQLLKDRGLYRRAFYERSYHLNYYYEHHRDALEKIGGLARITTQRPLDSWEIGKLHLLWNIGLGDYNRLWGVGRHRPYWPWARHRSVVAEASSGTRPIHLSYRAGTAYMFPATTFHRSEIKRLVRGLAETGRYEIRWDGKLPYRAYMEEMARSLTVLSPFGMGEICWRDFESFLCGCLLLKPDMSHLETWPEYFESGQTYVPFAWDFKDLVETVVRLLDDPNACRRVAVAGQARYLGSISDAGGEQFAEWLLGLVNEAVRRA